MKDVFYSNGVFNCDALKCGSMNDQECKIRPTITKNNSSEPIFYLFSILVNKSNGSCNDINNSYAKFYVPDIVKNMNIKVFNLISRVNGTRYASFHILVHVTVD